MRCGCQVYGSRAGLRSQLTLPTKRNLLSEMVDTEMLPNSPYFENHQESEGEYRYRSQSGCARSNSLQHVNSFTFRRLNLPPSFGFSAIIFLVILASVCLRPCAGGVNCSSHDIDCYHGTCITPMLPVAGVDRTVMVICSCDKRWSGPACNVFSCSGRTL